MPRPTLKTAATDPDKATQLVQNRVQQAEQQHDVGAGQRLQMQAGPVVGQRRRRAVPRIDDDQTAALPGADRPRWGR